MAEVLVLADHVDGQVKKSTYELLAAARALGEPSAVVVAAPGAGGQLTDGLKRRCLHLFIDFPAAAEELAIIRLKVPEVSERLSQEVVKAVQRIRALELRKAPSISESLDWVRSLVILNADRLEPGVVEATLTLLVKYERDLERVKASLDKVLAD